MESFSSKESPNARFRRGSQSSFNLGADVATNRRCWLNLSKLRHFLSLIVQVVAPIPESKCDMGCSLGAIAHTGCASARSHLTKTVLIEELQPPLTQWQQFYNQERTIYASGCRTPQPRLKELKPLLPTPQAVYNQYHPQQESYVTNSCFRWGKSANPTCLFIDVRSCARINEWRCRVDVAIDR
jgi:hypothetical protein